MKPYYVEFCWSGDNNWRLWSDIPHANKKSSSFETFQDAYAAITECWKAGFHLQNNIFIRASDNCKARILKRRPDTDWSIGFNEIINNYENNKKVS